MSLTTQPRPFLAAPFADEDIERAMLLFHLTARPRIVSWYVLRHEGLRARTADFLADVEVRLLQRLRRQIHLQVLLRLWRGVVPPLFGNLIREFLAFRTRPRVAQRQKLAEVVDSICVRAPSQDYIKTLSDVISAYTRHISSNRIRRCLLSRTSDLASFLIEHGLPTGEHVAGSVQYEVKFYRPGPQIVQPIGFATEQQWLAYCTITARNTLMDALRKSQREKSHMRFDSALCDAVSSNAPLEDGE